MKIKKQNLLLLASLVWMIAGFNVLRIGIETYAEYQTVINYIVTIIVFLLFWFMVFYKLTNKHTIRIQGYEEEKQLFDFVVSRAVMPLTDLLKIIRKNISPKQQNALPNGLICLKGGELERETMPVKNKTTMWNLKEFFGEEFFETKKVVYVAN